MRRRSLHIRLWARVFTKTSPRWGFCQKPIWGFCRNLFYETPQIFSWGFYRNFNEVSRKNSPGSWGFYRNLFEVSVETYFMKQGSGVYPVRQQDDHRKWNTRLNGPHWPMQFTPHFLLGILLPNQVLHSTEHFLVRFSDPGMTYFVFCASLNTVQAY